MTIDARVARTVRAVRAKLRELAAAEHQTAANATQAAAATKTAEETQLAELLDGASGVLCGVTSVHELDDLGDLVASQRASCDAASGSYDAAQQISELSAARLRARTRQLKTAERVVEIIRHERARRESKADQLRNDDLSTARRR